MHVIELEKLTKTYHRSRGIDQLDLAVRQGDIFGFIGPNGAGKSTTIRILLNLIFPTSGRASIFGMDAVRDSKAIRKRIGYVPSDASFYDRMTVSEFLSYGAAYYGTQNNHDRTRYLLEMFDLDPARRVADLSTGNKKKVSIIQSMIHKPELLILDEPTSGLDPLIQSRFFDLLHTENQQGTTIFFSSHTLSEVQAFCKTVAIVKEGRIVATEEIASLRNKQLKKVKIRFPQLVPVARLNLGAWITSPIAAGPNLEFLFSGDLNLLVGRLATIPFDNLSIEEPSLEEIFLHYYK